MSIRRCACRRRHSVALRNATKSSHSPIIISSGSSLLKCLTRGWVPNKKNPPASHHIPATRCEVAYPDAHATLSGYCGKGRRCSTGSRRPRCPANISRHRPASFRRIRVISIEPQNARQMCCAPKFTNALVSSGKLTRSSMGGVKYDRAILVDRKCSISPPQFLMSEPSRDSDPKLLKDFSMQYRTSIYPLRWQRNRHRSRIYRIS